MESIIRDKIVTHMQRNNLLSQHQHGFVPLRNCVTNLLLCMEKWTKMIDDGLPIDIIYTDFSKPFDRVPHRRLLRKISNMGIIGMIRAFQTGRTQRVRVEREFSSWAQVKSDSRAYFICNVHK